MNQDINVSMISNHDSNKLNWSKLNYNENVIKTDCYLCHIYKNKKNVYLF